MTTKTIELTEQQRHALGSLIAHTVGFECLNSLFDELYDEFKPRKPWLEVKVMRRDYRQEHKEIAVLGKVYRNAPGEPAHDYILSNLE